MKIKVPSMIILSFTFTIAIGVAQERYSEKIHNSIENSEITYKLTDTCEIKEILGKPFRTIKNRDGGLDLLKFFYPQTEILFGKPHIYPESIYTIIKIIHNGKEIDIGRNKKLSLRSAADLRKLDKFNGLKNVSLKKTDLSDKTEFLSAITFNTETEWPDPDKLPPNFSPKKMIERGKYPGLNIKTLHTSELTGRGIGIAIIDQPLLLNHVEYRSSVISYDAENLEEFPPQMHGSPIVSIAAGKNIGVAPAASIYYYAVPMWQKDNYPYIKVINKIFKLNKTLPDTEKIRVISISDGRFARKSNYREWSNILKKATEQGIFVVTCDYDNFKFGTLTLKENADPDSFSSYIPGKYSSPEDVLRVPTGNKTVAGHKNIHCYTFEREGGRSWAAPYLAGLAAIAFQIDHSLKPEQIKAALIQTAVHSSSGPIVNPVAFVREIKRNKK